MSARLSENRYGESDVRLVRLSRRGDRHEVKDLQVAVQLTGQFEAAFANGDNRRVLQPGTVRNTVHALAGRHAGGEIEEFALALSHHFMLEHDALSGVSITIRERHWGRVAIGGRPQGRSFIRSGEGRRVAVVRRSADDVIVEAGIEDLQLLETSSHGFEGFMRDRYTAGESTDGLRETTLNARWRYGWIEIPFGVHWQQVRELMLSTFAEHESHSMQHALLAMAQTAIEQCPPLAEIRIRLDTRAHLLADLAPFGLPNEGEVFAAAEDALGTVEATVRREEIR